MPWSTDVYDNTERNLLRIEVQLLLRQHDDGKSFESSPEQKLPED